MQRYYFAGCRLTVTGQDTFLGGGPLYHFREKRAFSDEIALDILSEGPPAGDGGSSVGSGIFVRDGRDTWRFFCGDADARLSIEASRDCAALTGSLSPALFSGGDAARADFMLLLRLAAECRLAHVGGVSIHAACVHKGGSAVLFTAPSGVGKSTQATLWERNMGATIINGDRPFLRLTPGGVRAYGVPWDGKEQLFLQRDYPVAAVVEVRRADKNSVRGLAADQAFQLLMKQCFIPMWDDAAKFSVMATLRTISRKVPFYRLFCRPEAGAAELLNKVLFENNATLLKKERADMRLKEGFILKNVLDEWIVLPTGENIKKFEGAIVLNEAAAFIWKQLEQPISRGDLLAAVLNEYDIDEKTAASDLDELLEKLKSGGILQEA